MIRENRQKRILHRFNEYTEKEQELIISILEETERRNVDNISRTISYASYYERNKEIRWSFLASMVSRNAGWNMTDLEGVWFRKALNKSTRDTLFMTYEKANWLIFSDAYPQLLLYEKSKQQNKPLFYLLRAFSVSRFMEEQWNNFWFRKNGNQLVTAQIINEQNVIQKPVIEHPFYKKKVFKSFIFKFQDWLHFSSVLFPTVHGELYGFSVHDFRKVGSRVELGKKLALLLFHVDYYPQFYIFSKRTVHTGSRYDYEQYFVQPKPRDTPFLRTTFPIIKHIKEHSDDWFYNQKVIKKWLKPITKLETEELYLTDWYLHKQKQLHLGISVESLLRK
jgi:hypothetical protein